MAFRPFKSTKQLRWYLVNKKKGTLPANYFKMRWLKAPAASKTQAGILSRDIPRY